MDKIDKFTWIQIRKIHLLLNRLKGKLLKYCTCMCLKNSSFNGWLIYMYTIYTVFSYYGFKNACLYEYQINLHFLLFVSKEEKE